MPKKFRPAGDYGLLKASTLKVKQKEADISLPSTVLQHHLPTTFKNTT